MANTAKGKVCVTGASGFIASWLVKRLLKSGYHVLGTVRDPGNHKKVGHLWDLEGARERLELVRADLLEEGSFDDAVMACEGVFHTASPIVTRSDSKEEMFNSAINGTLNVLRSCKKNPLLKRVVLTSSLSTVRIKDEAELPPNVSLDETSWSSIEYCESLQCASVDMVRCCEDPRREGSLGVCQRAQDRPCDSSSDLCYRTHSISRARPHCFRCPRFISRRDGEVHGVRADGVRTHRRRGELPHPGLRGRRRSGAAAVLDCGDLVALLARRFPSYPVPRSLPSIYGEQSYGFDTSKARALGLEFKGVEEMFDDAVGSLVGHGHLPAKDASTRCLF